MKSWIPAFNIFPIKARSSNLSHYDESHLLKKNKTFLSISLLLRMYFLKSCKRKQDLLFLIVPKISFWGLCCWAALKSPWDRTDQVKESPYVCNCIWRWYNCRFYNHITLQNYWCVSCNQLLQSHPSIPFKPWPSILFCHGNLHESLLPGQILQLPLGTYGLQINCSYVLEEFYFENIISHSECHSMLSPEKNVSCSWATISLPF